MSEILRNDAFEYSTKLMACSHSLPSPFSCPLSHAPCEMHHVASYDGNTSCRQEGTPSHCFPVSSAGHESGDLLCESPGRGSAGRCIHADQLDLPVLTGFTGGRPLLLHEYSSQGCDQSSILQTCYGSKCQLVAIQ